MKKLACAIGVAALIGTPAFAADMPVKAPPAPPPAPIYNWNGWYVGGNVGGGISHDQWSGQPLDFPDAFFPGGGAGFLADILGSRIGWHRFS
jgi:opacity protein-like surface antigen